jgi:Mg-chelatase subunit ChlD
MKTTNVYNLIILDESGSMESIKKAAIDGCNETLQSIRSIQFNHPDQRHFVSLITFNSDNATKILLDRVPIYESRRLASSFYRPNSCTPLYDAMGISFTELQKSLNPSEKNCVLATIITDGFENASRIFDLQKLTSLIDELKKSGWTFVYIGANQDTFLESQKIHIDENVSFECSEESTNRMFGVLKERRASYAEKIAKGK